MTAHRKLVLRLVGAVLLAFVASMVFTWILHTRMTAQEAMDLIDSSFLDVEKAIRERVDRRMVRQAMLVRDRLDHMRVQPWWNDPDESSRRLRALADELWVDEICVADASGLLTHSARRDEVGALNFRTVGGQAGEFARLLDSETEVVQPLMPNTLRGDMVKYVGVWLPEGAPWGAEQFHSSLPRPRQIRLPSRILMGISSFSPASAETEPLRRIIFSVSM